MRSAVGEANQVMTWASRRNESTVAVAWVRQEEARGENIAHMTPTANVARRKPFCFKVIYSRAIRHNPQHPNLPSHSCQRCKTPFETP